MAFHIGKIKDTKANINAIGAPNYKKQFLYFSTDTHELAYGLENGSLSAWINPANLGTPYTFTDTASVDFTVTGSTVTAAVKRDTAADNLLQETASGLYAKKYSIASSSANYLSIDANNQISIKTLGIIDVSVDTTAASLAAWITASGYTGANQVLQEGDVLILTAATGGTQCYIHNGGTAGTAADFTLIESPNLSDSYVRGLFSANNGVSYDASSGQITSNDAYIRGIISAGNGLSYSMATGIFNLNMTGVAINQPLTWTGTGFSYTTFPTPTVTGAANGNTVVSGNVEMGGTLTKATAIGGNFDWSLSGTGKYAFGGAVHSSSKMIIYGDTEVSGSANGIILTSPNGTRWRCTIDNDGLINSTSL